MKKFLAGLLVLMLAITVFTGFEVKTAKADPNELKFYDNNSTAARMEFFQKAFDEYYEKTGVRFIYEGEPWGNSANTVTTMFTGGNGPDVYAHVGNEEVAVKNGWLYPIDDWIAEHGDNFVGLVTNWYWPNEKAAYDHNYVFPDATLGKGIYYRKDWVEEIGYEIPTGKDWNMAAFWDLAEKLTDPSKNRYGFSFRGGSGSGAWCENMLGMYTASYAYDPETLQWPFDDISTGMKDYTDSWLNHLSPEDSLNWGWAEQIDAFCSGLVGLFYNDSDCFPFMMERMEPGTWGVLQVPYDLKGRGIQGGLNPTYAYAISAQSENVEACLGLMEFLYEPDRNAEYCIMMGEIPVCLDVMENEYFAPEGPLGEFVKALDNPDVCLGGQLVGMNKTEWAGYTYDVGAEMQMYLLGEITFDELMAGYQEFNQTALDNYFAENPDRARDIIKMGDFLASEN